MLLLLPMLIFIYTGLTAREHAAAYGRMAKILYNILLGGLDNTRSEGEKFKVVDTFLQRHGQLKYLITSHSISSILLVD